MFLRVISLTINVEDEIVHICLSVVQERQSYRTDFNNILDENVLYTRECHYVYFRLDIFSISIWRPL